MIIPPFLRKILLYLVAAAILFVVGGFAGYTFCKRAQYTGIIKQQAKDATIMMKHQEKKDVVDEKVRNHLGKIQMVPDTTGCLDSITPDAYLDELLRADSIAEFGFD